MDSERYTRFVRREQERVAAVFRDRASLAERGLSPAELILEHAPRAVADNLVWDGRGWRMHMHLAPYGNGMLFDLHTSASGRIEDVAAPMTEQFPVTSWESTVFVDLGELAARGWVAHDVVGALRDAARALVLADAANRRALEAVLASPPASADKLVAFPAHDVPGYRSLEVVNFDAPVSLADGFAVEHVAGGFAYRTRPLPGGAASDCFVLRSLARLGVDPGALLAALGPSQSCVVVDPGSRRAIELRTGTGLVGEGFRLDAHWAIAGGGLASALAREDRLDALDALCAVRRWSDGERNVFRAVPAADAPAATPLRALLREDPRAWFD